ncbi:hypothetical protein MC7420_581 [Coleofasciculus chthonoplastes PCC 7420]|uniref:Uncharacterized protein n=1 Tax=Coleofasciculus chthonoplastes PCC 7420 TaxID=118168 RepID=B4VLQ7_9CYAN|nr:hypothetical protein MC7420_581 [Coleofasciculus chthonoplastes PCC 7420]
METLILKGLHRCAIKWIRYYSVVIKIRCDNNGSRVLVTGEAGDGLVVAALVAGTTAIS